MQATPPPQSSLPACRIAASTRRARLVRVVPTPEPGRLDFVLEAPEEALLRATQDFMAGEALVEPRRYAAARKALQKALRARQ